MKKIHLIIFSLLLLLVLAIIGWRIYCQHLYNSYKTTTSNTAPMHHAAEDSLSTNSIASYSAQEITIYGKWEAAAEEHSYTVFTLDDAEDGFFWGKEWCEADSVLESDLEDHGSGWFKWKVKKDKLLLLRVSYFDVLVPVEYTLVQLDDSIMGVKDFFNRRPRSFNRAYN